MIRDSDPKNLDSYFEIQMVGFADSRRGFGGKEKAGVSEAMRWKEA